MKATNLIRRDHENLKALFDKYKQSAARQQNGRKGLCQTICKEIEIHSDLERTLFYPELENTSSSHMTELLHDAENAHGTMDELVEQLRSSNGNETTMRTHPLGETARLVGALLLRLKYYHTIIMK